MQTVETTISEILEDPAFKDNVTKTLQNIIKQRAARPQPKPGYRYIKDVIDHLHHAGQLNTAYFLNNIPAIWAKESHLNAKARALILSVCNNAYLKSLHQQKNNIKPIIKTKNPCKQQ